MDVLLPSSSSSSSHYGSANADGPLAAPSSPSSAASSAQMPQGCSVAGVGFSGISSGFFRGLGGTSSHMHGGASTGVQRVHSMPPWNASTPKNRIPRWTSQPLQGMLRPAGGHGGAANPRAIAEHDVATDGRDEPFRGDSASSRKIRMTASRAGRSMKLMVRKAASVCAEKARRTLKPFKRS